MKIVNIIGGLGNQMFEYAMFLALKNAHPEEKILCSTRSFRGYDLHNGYELKRIFNIDVDEASLMQLARLAYPFFNYKSWQVMQHWMPFRKDTMTSGTTQIPFDANEVSRKGSVYYDGYWQNEKNFKQIEGVVIDAFCFPKFNDERNIALVDKIGNSISVSCHIRRGDYLKEPEMCVCTPAYYTRSIAEMNRLVNPNLYCVFSDDIEWCKQNIDDMIGNREIVFVDWNKRENSFRDMQLMSLCNHNIIANSSFSWWGAWLNRNKNKKVISPEKWMNTPLLNDPICDNWIRIKS